MAGSGEPGRHGENPHAQNRHAEKSNVVAINRIGTGDLFASLAAGFEDFRQKPSHLFFLALIYPVIGLLLAQAAAGNDLLPLVYPLISGFALLGPVAAIAFCEISRRREAGAQVGWRQAIGTIRSRSLGSVAIFAGALMIIFIVWIASANEIYRLTIGPEMPRSIGEFLNQMFIVQTTEVGFIADLSLTPEGRQLLIWGNLIGFMFAFFVLMIGSISFPYLLDRRAGPLQAVEASVRMFVRNPLSVSLWGLIIGAGLVIGSIPAFLGLAVVVPVLGHASWHLYRRAVAD